MTISPGALIIVVIAYFGSSLTLGIVRATLAYRKTTRTKGASNAS